MRKKHFLRLFGSSRSRFFKEPKRSSSRQRAQKVKFRRKVAATYAKSIGWQVWRLVQVTSCLALIGWGGLKIYGYWNSSPSLRVEKVLFKGPVPKDFNKVLNIKPGQNIIVLEMQEQEQAALKRFPELESVKISRHFDRTVMVEVRRRTPVALVLQGDRTSGVDASGVVFSLLGPEKDLPLPRIKASFQPDLMNVLKVLDAWKNEVPEFYSMVKFVETDKMHASIVDLMEGIRVKWGDLELPSAVTRARNILLLRQTFAPRATPADLRFVTNDRVVMDDKWLRINIKN